MSDAFFEKLFGDSEPGHFGTGWMSGTASVFFGLLGFVSRRKRIGRARTTEEIVLAQLVEHRHAGGQRVAVF